MGAETSLDQVREWSPFFKSLADAGEFEADRDGSYLNEEELRLRYRVHLESLAHKTVPEALRKLRRREMARIIYRDLTRQAELGQTTSELSCLADFCIQHALEHAKQETIARYGRPRGPDGREEQLSVLAMGKLGAFELNLSSDIDLIFFYDHQGETDGDRNTTNQEFFIRMARTLIACLDGGSIDFVFRVDMRLRPYGDSGPLVVHRAAMEKYYLEQGRDWERYAFIKARAVAGDIEQGLDFLSWMKPFVYRRHLDYGAIQSLREMKGLLAKQIEIKETRHDIKLGPGGIREIEFVVQAHQLIWGGRHTELQEPRLMSVLDQLSKMALISDLDRESLASAYIFLRNTEHAIQAEHDRQTHLLPESGESRQRIAGALGFDDWIAFRQELDARRQSVARCFAKLIASPEKSHLQVDPKWVDIWTSPQDTILVELRAAVQELDGEVVNVIDRLLPGLLQVADTSPDRDLAIERMVPVITSILRRSTYVVFLLENVDALKNAVDLVILSPWVAEQLRKYPILLYELTERALREVAVSKTELQGGLRELMQTVDPDDMESQMDTLRQFKLSGMFKIAAMELMDRHSIMQASDGLTALAEVMLESVIEMARRHLIRKHGEPCDDEGQPLASTFGVVAYGKAGGLELAYGSDLDLVFLSPDNISGSTNGDKSVSNNTFFLRLGQRIIHILTSFTRFGILYTADLRLRPQGNKGPLVATLNAYRRYLEKDAWTWEHQALVRARFLAGDAALGEAFADIRRSTLSRQRDPAGLLQDVLDMREKMRAHLGTPSRDVAELGMDVLTEFDLKQDEGAIVDIEFMVQYAVLGWAETHQSLTRWTDVMRILDELAQAGILDESEADSLQRAFLAFRAAIHHGWLGLETDFGRLQTYRKEVRQIWERRMLTDARPE